MVKRKWCVQIGEHFYKPIAVYQAAYPNQVIVRTVFYVPKKWKSEAAVFIWKGDKIMNNGTKFPTGHYGYGSRIVFTMTIRVP
jgi:hypothetical protein